MAINFAIITAGNISSKMAATVQKMSCVNRYAVAARDPQRAKEFAEKYGFEKWYGSYQELFDDPNVELVYIGSPHSHHYQHTKQTILSKKHILCEKPFTVNAKQAEELFALAKQNGVVAAEATWTRFMPFVPALQNLLQSERLGKPLSMDCSFGFPVCNRPRMKHPEMAGGALLDLGIYPLTMAAIAFGSDVEEISGVCTKTDAGVDAHNAISIKFKQGQIASLHSNMMCKLDNSATIYCEKGYIKIPMFWCAQGFTVHPNDEQPQEYSFPHKISGYEYEVESICRSIQSGQTECPEMPHSETLHILRQMDILRQKWQICYPCESQTGLSE